MVVLASDHKWGKWISGDHWNTLIYSYSYLHVKGVEISLQFLQFDPNAWVKKDSDKRKDFFVSKLCHFDFVSTSDFQFWEGNFTDVGFPGFEGGTQHLTA